jgi:hypothetical protein
MNQHKKPPQTILPLAVTDPKIRKLLQLAGLRFMITRSQWLISEATIGGVAELVGIEGGVVSGVTNLESSGVEASDWRPRHDEQYHEA